MIRHACVSLSLKRQSRWAALGQLVCNKHFSYEWDLSVGAALRRERAAKRAR